MRSSDQKFWNAQMETMNLDDMRGLQEERFVSVCRHAYKRTKFYRRKFEEAGVSISDIRSLNDITKIPFIYKDDLRISQENMPPYGEHCASPENIYQTYWSTGTTGQPTFMGASYREAHYWLDVVARSLFSTGLRKKDLFHHATQLSSFPGGYLFLWGAQRIGANIVPAGAGNTERHLKLISKLKPRFLKILPSYANYMAEVGCNMGMDMQSSSVELIYLSAEPSPPELRREIERKWGAITFDNYGLSDVGQPQAYECEIRDGLHTTDDWCFTEIIDPETKEPIWEEGREGVLVYTNLVRKAMPIIRFWTDNPSSWKTFGPCECGRVSPRITPVTRRTDDTIKIKGVNFWPGAIWTVLKEHPELAGTHRILVESRGGKDYLKIEAELKGDSSDIDASIIAEELKGRFQSSLFIRVDEIKILPFGVLTAAEHKAKTLIDKRPRL